MSRSMRLAFINKYQGKVNRGAETFVKEVSYRLGKNHQVDIIAKVNYADLLKKKYDLIIPTNGRFQVILVRLITWLTGGKMIVSGQSGMGWDDRVNLYSFPDYFIPISSEALEWARKINPLVKSVYIPNGVDTKKFKPEGERLDIKLKRPIILCVGALTETKRIDLVIKAVAKLKNASLLVVGDGDLREKIQALGTESLGTRFQLIKLPYEEMPKVYQAADVFTLVSEPYYSFENVLVEAMASGLPVVANDDPIRREIVGDAGILVDPVKTSEYAKALEKALDMECGNKPRKQAEKFSWDKIAEKYEKLFSGLVPQ